MRNSKTVNGLKVNAISGTYVVLLGFDLLEKKCEGFLGFSIHRLDHNENEAYYLTGMKAFVATDPGYPSGSLYSTKYHPIQSFQWADYSAKPGYTYTYTIVALKGVPADLQPIAQVEIDITTESPEGGNHDVYFNRGTSATQEYVRRFGDKRPDQIPNNKAFEWLSRGIYEALENYVNTCIPGKHALRVAAYEFNYEPFLRLLKTKIDQGVDIHIVFDARKASPRDKNKELIALCGLNDYATPRTEGASYISHNKFIIKLDNNKPMEVWTGGMNFSEGGIFGHSNVVHIVQETKVAEKYFEYWNRLKENLKPAAIKIKVEALTPLPRIPLQSNEICLFSPRKSLDAMQMYGSLAMSAKNALFITFAFGINKIFQEVYRDSIAPLRFALLEKATRPMKKGPEKDAALKDIQDLRNAPENVFAIGDFIKTNEFDGWLKESLSGLNNNVKYVHNKFMLIDPLSKNPIVITGSANFSNASTTNNDENMVIISGNTRIADIYLGEFMRLFSHHSFRESLKWRTPNEPPKPLRTDDWWRENFGNSSRSNRRIFFSQTI